MAVDREKDKVSMLTDQELHWWDVEIVTNYFPPNIAYEILKIKLLIKEQADRLIWDFKKKIGSI